MYVGSLDHLDNCNIVLYFVSGKVEQNESWVCFGILNILKKNIQIVSFRHYNISSGAWKIKRE
jgi:hypothetical protein